MTPRSLALLPLFACCALIGQEAASAAKPAAPARKIEATKASVRAELVEHIELLKKQISEMRELISGMRRAGIVPDEVWKDILVSSQHELTLALAELAKLAE